MKKVGFKRKIKINIDWGEPGVIFTTVFLIITLVSSIIITFSDASWSECWPVVMIFGTVTFVSLLVHLATKD